jgi:transposase
MNAVPTLDVHKKTVVTTVMITQTDGNVQESTRTFSTMTVDLLALDDWLRGQQIQVIAMESTGVFWRPVFNLLEEGREVILVNAQHMRVGSWSQDRCQGQSVARR